MAKDTKTLRKIAIGLAVIALITFGYFIARYYMKVPVLTQSQLFEVKAATVTDKLRENVTLNSGTTTVLAFENAGKISNVYVDIGDNVKKGQLLAEETNADYVVTLNEQIANQEATESLVEAAHKNANMQKEKLRSLKKANAAKYDIRAQEEAIDQAKAQEDSEESLLDAAKEAVKGANIDLAKTRLLAPMNGVITEKSIEIGEVVAQAGSVMILTSGDNMEADAYVSQLDVKKIAVGDEAELIFDMIDEASIKVSAKIKSIDPAQTEINGIPTYKVTLELSEQKPELKLGMTGTANIQISERKGAVSVPQSSVFSSGDKKYVITLDNGIPQSKDVQTGIYGSDGMVEILSGLAVGDKVVAF